MKNQYIYRDNESYEMIKILPIKKLKEYIICVCTFNLHSDFIIIHSYSKFSRIDILMYFVTFYLLSRLDTELVNDNSSYNPNMRKSSFD